MSTLFYPSVLLYPETCSYLDTCLYQYSYCIETLDSIQTCIQTLHTNIIFPLICIPTIISEGITVCRWQSVFVQDVICVLSISVLWKSVGKIDFSAAKKNIFERQIEFNSFSLHILITFDVPIFIYLTWNVGDKFQKCIILARF